VSRVPDKVDFVLELFYKILQYFFYLNKKACSQFVNAISDDNNKL